METNQIIEQLTFPLTLFIGTFILFSVEYIKYKRKNTMFSDVPLPPRNEKTKTTLVDDDKAGEPEFEQYFIDESCKTCSSLRKGSKCHEFHECSSHSREYFKVGFNARKNN